LEVECNVVHLSSGDMLRDEVSRNTALGRQVRDIMSRGELVSSAIMVALMKKRMRDHPGKRVLLDGFPRSLENAHDLVTLCGKPELALHLQCDDTFLMERVMGRGASSGNIGEVRREDDNFQTALQRLRTYHKYHHVTMELLREQHVPIVNLDCSGSAESVWDQLKAIGRLMRPAVKSRHSNSSSSTEEGSEREDWSNDPSRTALF
jgi:adenylate kinase